MKAVERTPDSGYCCYSRTILGYLWTSFYGAFDMVSLGKFPTRTELATPQEIAEDTVSAMDVVRSVFSGILQHKIRGGCAIVPYRDIRAVIDTGFVESKLSLTVHSVDSMIQECIKRLCELGWHFSTHQMVLPAKMEKREQYRHGGENLYRLGTVFVICRPELAKDLIQSNKEE